MVDVDVDAVPLFSSNGKHTMRSPRYSRRSVVWGPGDLVKKVLLLCICVIVSLTVNTLPHLQKVLDRINDNPLLAAMENFPASGGFTVNVRNSMQQSRNDQQHGCLIHRPVQAQFDHVKEANTSRRILRQPSLPVGECGQLLRRDWSRTSTLPISKLAFEIREHQSNCSLPVMDFHVDNNYGLGSHLMLWSQAWCNAWETGHRIRTINPDWLWLDQSYCTRRSAELSPLLCYFPEVEFRCGTNKDLRQPHINVTDPKNRKKFCRRLREDSSDEAMSNFRAASMEYIFQRVSPIVVQEAKRQIGLLFGGQAPTNLITVHIRWGDKFFEMDLAPIKEYIDAINQLLTEQRRPKNEAVHIYLATEDPRAAKEFLNQTENHWHVYLDRTITEMDAYRPARGNRASWTTRNTKGRSGLVALGSLLVAMEADSFVLTTKSNWSRMIDALRRKVVDPICGNCTSMIDLRPGVW